MLLVFAVLAFMAESIVKTFEKGVIDNKDLNCPLKTGDGSTVKRTEGRATFSGERANISFT